MTNLVIPHVVTVSNVAMSNVIVVTNADGGTVTMTQKGMTTVSSGPGALVIAFLVVAMIGCFFCGKLSAKDKVSNKPVAPRSRQSN